MQLQQRKTTVRRGPAVMIAGLLLAVALQACGGGGGTMPDVVGRPEAEARKTLEDLGVDVKVTKARKGGAPGLVLEQTPKPKAPLPESEAQLVVEDGTAAAQGGVPNVIAKPVADAETALVAAGFKVGTKTRQPSASPAGTVLDQNPKPAAQVAAGTAVDLVVVDETIAVMPNLIGTEEAAALAALTQAGLKIGAITRRLEGSERAGLVVDQNPKQGLQIVRDQPVDLTVKDDGVRVPNVVGRPLDTVAVSLLSSGLRYRMERRRNSGQPQGTILEVRPGAETLVPRDSEVVIVLARDLMFEGPLKNVLEQFEKQRLRPLRPR